MHTSHLVNNTYEVLKVPSDKDHSDEHNAVKIDIINHVSELKAKANLDNTVPTLFTKITCLETQRFISDTFISLVRVS